MTETDWMRASGEVAGAVNREEFGRRDEYDYCNGCLVELAPTLAAAGSRSRLVTGEDPPEDEEDDDD